MKERATVSPPHNRPTRQLRHDARIWVMSIAGALPACIVALDSKTQSESTLYDVGRYEVRNMIMAEPGAVSPVVYGGKIRAVMVYLDRKKLEKFKLA